MYRAMNDLFASIQAVVQEREITVKVSYLEIYNENIKDLLTADDKSLDIREDPASGVVVHGVSEIEVRQTSEIFALLKVGNKNRTMEPTAANEVSSRSHAILTIALQIRERTPGLV